ncbi:hypothetical protein [Nocardioides sp. AN3]
MTEVSTRGTHVHPAVAMSLIVVASLLGLQACSSGTPAICEDVSSLKSSVDDLKNVKIDGNVLTTVSTDLQAINDDLKQLTSDADSEFGGDVDKVTAAAKQVETSVQSAAATPSAATIGAVATAVQGLVDSIKALDEAVSAKKC